MLAPTLPRPPPAWADRKFDPALPGGFVDGVGGFELTDLPTELRGDLGAGLVAQAQKDAGAERLQECPPRLGTAEHGAQRADGLRGDDGDHPALPGEGKRFFVAARIVLADAGEGLVFVADKDGRPDVAIGLGLHRRRLAEQRLEPRIFQHDADGAGQRRVGAGGHVEGQHLPALDQRIEGRKIDAFHGGRRERRGVGAGRVVRVAGRVVEPPRLGRGGAKHASHGRHVEHAEEHRDAFLSRTDRRLTGGASRIRRRAS